MQIERKITETDNKIKLPGVAEHGVTGICASFVPMIGTIWGMWKRRATNGLRK